MKQPKWSGSLLVIESKLGRSKGVSMSQWFVYFLDEWRAIKLSKGTGSWQVLSRTLGVRGVLVSARSAAEAIDWAKSYRP